VGYAPRDLALKDIREEARREICAAYGVPPALVGAWEAANYATIREQSQSLYTKTINPGASYIEGVINAELASEFEAGLEFRFRFDDLPELQETINDRAKRLVWMKEAGVLKAEVVAVEMGYEAEDVPETPPAPKPSDNNNLASVGSRAGDTLREEKKTASTKTESALRKWRRKCLNRLKNDQDAACDFVSEYVSDILTASIQGQLDDAETPKEVHEIFENAVVWSDYP
jgi:hypothetical protein